MQNRVSMFPGRIKLHPVAGEENVFDVERADKPEVEGTPINKTTLLQDAAAALAGLDEEKATPNDVFMQILTRLLKLETIVIPASGWAGVESPYTQTVTVPYVSADETARGIFPVPSSASLKEWNRIQVQAVSQGNAQLTFEAQEPTSMDLTVYVLIQGVL